VSVMRVGKMKKMKETALGCDTVSALLSRYQDNELDRDMQVKISTHLLECDACRKELESLEQVTHQVKQLPEVDTAVNFSAVLMGKIIEKEKEKIRWFKLPSLAYSFVFILFLLLGAWFTSSLGDINGASGQNQTETYIAQLLTESQNLHLINVQENAMELLDTGNGNGATHEK
jgi:predicted anti-sigma-YlaC factor YlaD